MSSRGANVQDLRTRLVVAAGAVGAVFAIGVVGYHALAPGETWLEAVYATATVLTTAGFTGPIDVARDPGLMAFTVILLFFGAGTVVYAISIVTAFVVEGDLTQGFRRRRMRRAITEMEQHYIVCGVGATGIAVLRELVSTERPVVAIEHTPERVRRVEDEFPEVPVLEADFTDDQVLLQAGIQRAAGIVVCTTIDKDSLVTTVTARQLAPKIRVIARAGQERSIARLRQAGADGVVSPALIGGMRMASELVRPSVVSFLDMMLRDTNKNLRIEEVTVPAGSPFVGRTLAELDLHARTSALVLAVHEPGRESYTYNPPDAERLEPGATLIVMGDPATVRALHSACDGAPAAVEAG
ncbi:MAG: potassium channel protein [Gemmatimonadota bacterium]|nr:potassium channel protein [Gemmatimonadota bacterium]